MGAKELLISVIIALIIAFGMGYCTGRLQDMDNQKMTQYEKRLRFIKTVYEQNDRWCASHLTYCERLARK